MFHPYGFRRWSGGEGNDYCKQTCLWTDGAFQFPQKKPIEAFLPFYRACREFTNPSGKQVVQ